VQAVAFVVDHCSVDAAPGATVAGLNAIITVGVGNEGVCFCDPEPPPEQPANTAEETKAQTRHTIPRPRAITGTLLNTKFSIDS
jgi:hypothetical protein